MSRQYTRQRAQSGKCSPPTRKSSGKTTVLAEDDHLARAWETVAEKEARYAIGAARAAERSERATASAAARKEARETDRMNELGLAAAIENSLAPPSPNAAGAGAAAAPQVKREVKREEAKGLKRKAKVVPAGRRVMPPAPALTARERRKRCALKLPGRHVPPVEYPHPDSLRARRKRSAVKVLQALWDADL
jgi:hypothetical protein